MTMQLPQLVCELYRLHFNAQIYTNILLQPKNLFRGAKNAIY